MKLHDSDVSHPGWVRERLRSATYAQHRQLDLNLTRLLGRPDTGYGDYLCLMASIVLPLEDALERANVVATLPDWSDRRRTSALLRDLRTLAIPTPALCRVELPADEAYLLGTTYVLEGSRLGARALASRNKSVCRDAVGFLEHGHTPSLWRSFLARLEQSTTARVRIDTTISGASDAFDLFLSAARTWIDAPCPVHEVDRAEAM